MKTLIVAAALLCAFMTASAQSTITPSHRQAAGEFLEAMGAETAFNKSIDVMLEGQVETNPQLAGFAEVMRRFMQKYMSWESVKDEITDLYAESFTETELRRLTEFYRTDLGKKLARVTPELTAKGAEIGQRAMMEHQTELQMMIMEELQKMQQEEENAPVQKDL